MHDQTARKRQEQEDDGDTPHDLLSPKARFEVANFVRLRDAISKEKGRRRRGRKNSMLPEEGEERTYYQRTGMLLW